MTTKDQLRAQTLLDRGFTRAKDDATGRFSVVESDVDKTPLMLYTEGVTGIQIKQILLMQMSTRRLAEWIGQQIGRPITQATVVNWRKRLKIYMRRRDA